LATAYAEPQRHYHNQQHIGECLEEFDHTRHLARQPAVVELALWFHDAIYDPRRSDNEEQSAALGKRCARESGLSDDFAETLVKLVMATKTHEVAGDSDAALVVDIDLSILGREEPRFAEYERRIREEYAWVAQAVFAAKRAEILQRFCERERIFSNEWVLEEVRAPGATESGKLDW